MRINIEDSFFIDPRTVRLAIKLGSEDLAYGMLLRAFKLAQKFWCNKENPKQNIPEEAFKNEKLDILIDLNWAKQVCNSYYIHGTEKNFKWWFEASDKGKKSAAARFKKYGTAQPKNPNRSEPCSNRSEQARSSSSSSSSSSCSNNNKINNNTYGMQQEIAAKPKADKLGEKKRQLISFYVTQYKELYNITPILSGKEKGILFSFLKATSEDNLEKIFNAFFQLKEIEGRKLKHDVWELNRYKNDILKMY
jgi:hypothetical protein